MQHETASPASPARLRRAVAAWCDWYARMGVLDPVGEPGAGARPSAAPAAPPSRGAAVAPVPRRPAHRDGERVQQARAVAAACGSLADLAAALQSFEGCSLRQTATRLCFSDGSPEARLMLIGEAPGAEEDRQGRPFVGPSGQLLDRMLAAIGLDRRRVWITNIVFWRPPGNRAPTTAEVAVCQPFVERQIVLLRPRHLLFLGGSAARGLLEVGEGVSRLRGRPFAYRPEGGEPIPATIMFHPAYLLRQPLQKRLAWRDLLALRRQLADGAA
jgi:DNA polymerase